MFGTLFISSDVRSRLSPSSFKKRWNPMAKSKNQQNFEGSVWKLSYKNVYDTSAIVSPVIVKRCPLRNTEKTTLYLDILFLPLSIYHHQLAAHASDWPTVSLRRTRGPRHHKSRNHITVLKALVIFRYHYYTYASLCKVVIIYEMVDVMCREMLGQHNRVCR